MYSRPLTDKERKFVKKYISGLKAGSVIGVIFLVMVMAALNGGYLFFCHLSPAEMNKAWMIVTVGLIDILLLAGFVFLIKTQKRSSSIQISDVSKISGIYKYSLDEDVARVEHYIGELKVVIKTGLSRHIKQGESISAEIVVITRPVGKRGFFVDTLVLSVNDKYYIDKNKKNI